MTLTYLHNADHTINWVPIISQILKHMNSLLVSNTLFLRFQTLTDTVSGEDKVYVSLSLEHNCFRVC